MPTGPVDVFASDHMSTMESHGDDQHEAIAFLSRGESYGFRNLGIDRIDTHCSIIFLVAGRAYKLKRAIAFSLLDYSTVARREKACRAELELNQRTAPELYLGLKAIRRRANGGLGLDGVGEAVDWVVVMRRFAQNDLFDHMADGRRLDPPLMRQLATEIATLHEAAEVMPDHGGAEAIGAAIERWRQEYLGLADAEEEPAASCYREIQTAFSSLRAVLDDRRKEGKVRRCHGDLRLANICLLDDRATLFDAIEFSDELNAIDVLYDLAFLLMDLQHRGLAGFANLVVNRYLDVTGDIGGLPALPLFLSLRAAIRAQMLAAAASRQRQAAAAHLETLARSHLALSLTLLRRDRPRIIVLGGLSSRMKSDVASSLAESLGPAPGARVIRGDVVRRRIITGSADGRLTAAAYEAAIDEQVDEAVRREAAATLAAGMSVIIDGAFPASVGRCLADLAGSLRHPVTGLWLGIGSDTPAPSGGKVGQEVGQEWHCIDTARGAAAALAAARLLAERAPPCR